MKKIFIKPLLYLLLIALFASGLFSNIAGYIAHAIYKIYKLINRTTCKLEDIIDE